MTAAPAARIPFQPNPKALSTAKSSQLLALAGQTPSHSRSSSRAKDVKPRREVHKEDPGTDRSTSSLIRRVLIPEGHHGPDAHTPPQALKEALPPLTSSNDVDVQLYAVLAIVVKDFVNTWYSRITPDHMFVDEVIQIIAHCSRALEQRLRATDVVELCLDEIPVLLEQHIGAYRTAKAAHLAHPYSAHPRQIYHNLNPHPALSPNTPSDQQIQAEATYRQLLIQGTLAALLPTEDLQNSCLRILVTDVIADLILGRSIGDKVCDAWFLHNIVSKVIAIMKQRMRPAASIGPDADNRSRLEKYGLLTTEQEKQSAGSQEHHQSSPIIWLWAMLQYAYLTYLALRFTIAGLVHARNLPFRARRPPFSAKHAGPSAPANKSSCEPSHLVLAYNIFPAVSALLDFTIRMPWLESALSFWQHILVSGPFNLGGPDSRLDKFLYHNIETYILPVSLLPILLSNVRSTIFPGNSLGPPAPPPPSPEEALRIRRGAAEDILSTIPLPLARLFFAAQDEAEIISQIEEDILDVFSDTNMNKHLIYGILELILVRLIPELAEKTPSELLSERGVNIDYGEQEIL